MSSYEIREGSWPMGNADERSVRYRCCMTSGFERYRSLQP